MVFCVPIAGAAANAIATGAGLGISQSANDQAEDIFIKQMIQAKRFFTAQWSQASYQNSENLAQAQQQFSQEQSLGLMAYYQSEKMNAQAMRLGWIQDARNYEVTWRTIVREMIRDDLTNRFNQYNTLLLVDTVALGFVYGMINPDGSLPEEFIALNPRKVSIYVFFMALEMICFIVSLWICVILLRRLNFNTASSLEVQLFATSEEVQQQLKKDMELGVPSGENLTRIVYEESNAWFEININKLGNQAFATMTFGIMSMFICAAIAVVSVYYPGSSDLFDGHFVMADFFWVSSGCLIVAIFVSKYMEDTSEKRKTGAYQKSFSDENDKYLVNAKIDSFADELISEKALHLISAERSENYLEQEVAERQFIGSPQFNHSISEQMRKEADLRSKIRESTQLTLTTAPEEIDTLPEDTIGKMNKVILDIGDVDKDTSNLVSATVQYLNHEQDNQTRSSQFLLNNNKNEGHMVVKRDAVDASEQQVPLKALRVKLGDSALSSILRIRNTAKVPLRMKSGLTLKSGSYLKDVTLTSKSSENSTSKNCYQLFPITEIPPLTEVVIVARNNAIGGIGWLPTSSIEGKLVYMTKDESVSFRISFTNTLHNGASTSSEMNSKNQDPESECWQISQETIDHRRNSEVLISIEYNPSLSSKRKTQRATGRWSCAPSTFKKKTPSFLKAINEEWDIESQDDPSLISVPKKLVNFEASSSSFTY